MDSCDAKIAYEPTIIISLVNDSCAPASQMVMKSSGNNTAANALTAGVTAKDIVEAVERSGYPLQTLVAAELSKSFHLREEWSYIDRDSGGLRTTDILASQPLYVLEKLEGKVRPELNLIIECKKTELPLVFFGSTQRPWTFDFPSVAGLNHTTIKIKTDDDRSSWTLKILHALDLQDHPFLLNERLSSTFGKCNRKGSGLELSGDETYNGIVLPLIKAVSHFELSNSPRDTHVYFDARLTLPIAVVDAPMVHVELKDGKLEPLLKPWIRVARHEYDKDSTEWHKDRLWGIEIVHISFLKTYIEEHLIPFALEFGKRVLAHDKEIASGKGFVSGMSKDSFRNLSDRLRPR